jgi:hypothetical protein
MKIQLLTLLLLGLVGLVGCYDQEKPTTEPTAPSSTTPQPTPPASKDPTSNRENNNTDVTGENAAKRDLLGERTTKDADNTARNDRDDGTTLTPIDQGTSESDVTITQTIRKAVVNQEALSVNAQNIKIITNAGTVTLRGPVKSASERDMIVRLARAAPGVVKIDNQLEITERSSP